MRKVEASRIDKIYTDLYKDSAAEAPSLQSPELGQQDKTVFWLFLSFFFFFFYKPFSSMQDLVVSVGIKMIAMPLY